MALGELQEQFYNLPFELEVSVGDSDNEGREGIEFSGQLSQYSILLGLSVVMGNLGCQFPPSEVIASVSWSTSDSASE